MARVRIKKAPQTGDQIDYSLVTTPPLPSGGVPASGSTVSHSLKAVPRDQANLEAEGGETVVGDVNSDGYL